MGILFVVIDPLEGLSAQLKFPGPPKAVVDADALILEHMRPVNPAGRMMEPDANVSRLGLPERKARGLLKAKRVTVQMGVSKPQSTEEMSVVVC